MKEAILELSKEEAQTVLLELINWRYSDDLSDDIGAIIDDLPELLNKHEMV